ncbi:MAG: arabinofuranosyltransferase [candidate division Zixibacteria bacterium]|nr:arabinofuranosyltransferase [candidate division Zixibacteria bacterium]
MKNLVSVLKSRSLLPAVVTAVLLLFGVLLFLYALPEKDFSDELLITDCIWLDAWALAFFLVVVAVWMSGVSRKAKSRLLIGLFSWYGFLVVCLVLDGTPFGINAYWGDQKFRTAMILKFVSFFGWPDFYYRDLPSFYPPVYYFLLSLYARVFSVEAFKMIKIGTMLIYLVGPIVLYALWRKLVSPIQALLVTVFTFLFCSMGKNMPFLAPHAFVANSLFIPWWLYYIEQIRRPRGDWRFYLAGGIIGGLLFMTYYYPFFIGGLLLLARTVFRGSVRQVFESRMHLGQAWGVLVAAAVFSAPFWGPLVLGMLQFGSDAAQQEWHHLGSTGIAFKFMEFSIPGLLLLVSLFGIVKRFHQPVSRGLMLLTATVVVFYFLGAVLGALNRPINLIKANEFVPVLAGPMIGLLLARLLRLRKRRDRISLALPVLIAILLLFFLHEFNGMAKHPMIQTARTAYVPTFGLNAVEMEQRKGETFLAIEELYSFFPVYAFIAANEHYSHPASRFYDRYTFLRLLHDAADPCLTAIGFRHNTFDPIDYFMPRLHKDSYELYISLSNYPDRLKTKTLRFAPSFFDDSRLFRPETGDNLYAVLEPPPDFPMRDFSTDSPHDSLLVLARAKVLTAFLDPAGNDLVSNYLGTDWSNWRKILTYDRPFRFGDEISLISCDLVSGRDSLYMFFTVHAEQDIRPVYRMFLHVIPDDGGRMQNYDFKPEPATATWEKGDIFVLMRAIPQPSSGFKFGAGFFNEDINIESIFKAQVAVQP